jgi:hypothetical protein
MTTTRPGRNLTPCSTAVEVQIAPLKCDELANPQAGGAVARARASLGVLHPRGLRAPARGEQAPALDLGRALHAGPLNGSAWGSDGSTHPTEHGATLLSGVSDCARYFPDPNAP